MQTHNPIPPAAIDLGPEFAGRVSATPKQTCLALGFGLTRLYELLSDGALASYHEGKARRILVSSIREYLARRLAAGPPPVSPTRVAVAAAQAARKRRSKSDAGDGGAS